MNQKTNFPVFKKKKTNFPYCESNHIMNHSIIINKKYAFLSKKQVICAHLKNKKKSDIYIYIYINSNLHHAPHQFRILMTALFVIGFMTAIQIL